LTTSVDLYESMKILPEGVVWAGFHRRGPRLQSSLWQARRDVDAFWSHLALGIIGTEAVIPTCQILGQKEEKWA